MKKQFFISSLLISLGIFADILSPVNYRNQVINDCLAVNQTVTSLTQQGGQIDDLQSYINVIWLNVANDNNIPQSSKDYIVPYCQQAYYGLESVSSSLEALQQQNVAIYNTARSLQIDSGSGGSSVTNNYYYSSTNFYNTSNNSYYNSFVTNNYYTTDNNFYNSSVTNLSFYSSFTTNISNYTEVDLSGVLGFLSSIEGLDSILVSNFSTFLYSYTNFLSSIATLSSDISTLRSDISSIGSTVSELNDWFQWYSGDAMMYITSIFESASNIESYFYGTSQKITSINSILNSILTILPTWASRSIMFYDSMSSWTNRFWNIGNALYPVLKTSIVGPSSLSPSGWLSYDANHHLSYDYTFYDLFSNFFCREYPLFAGVIADYGQTNTIALATIARNTSSFNVASITNELRRQFSIFNVSSPLMDYYSQNGEPSYYQFLTNYYILVSTGRSSGSASQSHTNWFSRIEMLLASLVFKSDNVSTNTFDTPSSGSIESTFEGVLDNMGFLTDSSSDFVSTFDDSSRSFLSLLSALNSRITSLASCPSEIDLGSLSPSQTRDNSDHIVLQVTGNFKAFVDTLRAVTNICWITFFSVFSFFLARWLIFKLSGLISFCFSVLKTAIGVG